MVDSCRKLHTLGIDAANLLTQYLSQPHTSATRQAPPPYDKYGSTGVSSLDRSDTSPAAGPEAAAQHGEAVLPPFALLDADQHALAVDARNSSAVAVSGERCRNAASFLTARIYRRCVSATKKEAFSAGRAGSESQSPYPSKAKSVDPAGCGKGRTVRGEPNT
jgi:hypothetical protein